MADLDWLFSGAQPPPNYLNPTTEMTNLPAWYQTAQKALIGKASGIANESYTPYGGPKVAGLDPLQQQAIGSAATTGQAGGDTLAGAANLAGGAGTLFNQDDFNKFLSPYTEGVVDRIAQLGQRNLTENLLPQVNKSFVGSGMPFGSRHADLTAQTVQKANESILGQQALSLQEAQQQAMGDYQGALQRQAQTAGIQAGIGSAQTQNQIQAGGFQNLMGGVGQANQQQNLDSAYGDFINQKNYPLQQLDIVNSILKGYSPYQAKTQTTYGGTPTPGTTTQNPGNSALGALASFFGQ